MLIQLDSGVTALHGEMGDIIRGAIAPVFLLSGIGTFMLVLTQRLARVIDRVRALEEAAAGTTDVSARPQLLNLERRRHCILRGIRRLTLSAHAVAAVVVLLFLDYFTRLPLDKLVAVLFMASMLLFSAALFCLLEEVSLVVHGTPEDS